MLGLRLLWRDWRGGELGILTAAIVIAVAIVTGISLFADRLQQAITAQSSHFLAADRVLTSAHPIPPLWSQKASVFGLQQARIINFQSVIYASEAADATMQLVSIKAVSDTYPLRGELEISEQPFSLSVKTQSGPQLGDVWIDQRLLPLLNITMGHTIMVGEALLTVRKIIVNEPDRGNGMLRFGPRLLMNSADVTATGIVQPGSRVQYRYLFAGKPVQLDNYYQWLQYQLSASHKWLALKDSQPRIAQSLQRAEQFLLLAGAMGVGLAGIAIALAAKRYSERHYDYVAMMKSLGASSSKVLFIYVFNLLLLAIIAVLIGCAVGWLIQELFITLLSDYLDVTAVPVLSARPFLVGATTGLVCLFAFALPPLIHLQGISPLRVLRRDMSQNISRHLLATSAGIAGITLLMYWYSSNLLLTAAILGGVLLTFMLVGIVAWLGLRSAAKLGMQATSQWHLAMASIRRRAYQNTAQVVIFSLAIMLLLLLTLVRTSLITDWQLQLPKGTPNHFLINIAENDVEPIENSLRQQGLNSELVYPLVMGRLIAINTEAINDRVARTDPSLEKSMDREMGLTWANGIPSDNLLQEGTWWPAGADIAEVSVESTLASRLQLKLGDKLTFMVGSETLTVTLSSLRQLDWNTMKPNFYMVFPPGLLEQYPATYMTSFYLPIDKKPVLNSVLRQYPTITVIELDVVIGQIRKIVNQVGGAIELVLGLIVISGLLVLITSVQSSLDSRLQESAILRALGAQRQLILGSLAIEFSLLGALAGLLAAFSAELSVYFLQTQLLAMDYVFHPWVWLIGPLLGAVLIGMVGYISCRKVVNTPPINVLREL